jgi:hypothetical protein
MAKPTITPSIAPQLTSYTLTYSDSVKGFPSFYSFYPEQIQGMGQNLYTFKGGNMFVHNSDNVDRCTFYGDFTAMSVRSVLNEAPTTTKVFKTISLDSTNEWGFAGFTDLETGNIDSDYFELKEGNYFSFIRGNSAIPVTDSELPLRSSQGVGTPSIVITGVPANIIIYYPYKTVDNIMSVGDLLYYFNSGVYTLCGVITSIEKKSYDAAPVIYDKITVDSTTPIGGSAAITDTDYTFYVKNSVAESHGLRGYYIEFIIENYQTTQSEIFEVGSEVSKSFP